MKSWAKYQNGNICSDVSTPGFIPSVPFNCENSYIDNYSCKKCTFQADLLIFFKRHVEDYHGIKKETDFTPLRYSYNIQNYICKKCNFATHSCIKRLQHSTECLESKHSSEKLSPHVLKTVKIHKIQPHRKKKKPKNPRWHKCDQCDYQSTNASHLKAHIISKHLKEDELSWFYCDKCPYKTKNNSQMHLQNRHKHNNE